MTEAEMQKIADIMAASLWANFAACFVGAIVGGLVLIALIEIWDSFF